MTILRNSIQIQAPPKKVWETLASLGTLDKYDPVVSRSEVLPPGRNGLDAARRCDLAQGGWFKERIVEWEPPHSLAFELFECTLPVRRLKHRYELESLGGSTQVSQWMEYELKYGPFGRAMDLFIVRRKWDEGIKGFLEGLKAYVEEGRTKVGN